MSGHNTKQYLKRSFLEKVAETPESELSFKRAKLDNPSDMVPKHLIFDLRTTHPGPPISIEKIRADNVVKKGSGNMIYLRPSKDHAPGSKFSFTCKCAFVSDVRPWANGARASLVVHVPVLANLGYENVEDASYLVEPSALKGLAELDNVMLEVLSQKSHKKNLDEIKCHYCPSFYLGENQLDVVSFVATIWQSTTVTQNGKPSSLNEYMRYMDHEGDESSCIKGSEMEVQFGSMYKSSNGIWSLTLNITSLDYDNKGSSNFTMNQSELSHCATPTTAYEKGQQAQLGF